LAQGAARLPVRTSTGQPNKPSPRLCPQTPPANFPPLHPGPGAGPRPTGQFRARAGIPAGQRAVPTAATSACHPKGCRTARVQIPYFVLTTASETGCGPPARHVPWPARTRVLTCEKPDTALHPGRRPRRDTCSRSGETRTRRRHCRRPGQGAARAPCGAQDARGGPPGGPARGPRLNGHSRRPGRQPPRPGAGGQPAAGSRSRRAPASAPRPRRDPGQPGGPVTGAPARGPAGLAVHVPGRRESPRTLLAHRQPHRAQGGQERGRQVTAAQSR
jgi:hypothetical protein